MTIIKNKDIKIKILDTGGIKSISKSQVMINQVEGNDLDSGLMNIYLRTKDNNNYIYKRLIGPNSKLFVNKNTAVWSGSFSGIIYKVQLWLSDNSWFWEVKCKSKNHNKYDLTYIQDLGLGNDSYVKANEAYCSQYIDHYVSNDRQTFVSRQNQSQNGANPALQHGCFSKIDSFDTDGYEFYGTKYRENAIPEGMQKQHLSNLKLQYEMGIIALRTQKLSGNNAITFYEAFLENDKNANTKILFDRAYLYNKFQNSKQIFNQKLEEISLDKNISFNNVSGDKLTSKEIEELFPSRIQEEFEDDGQLLSFFTPEYSHVVLKEKDLKQQRETGNIIISQKTIVPTTEVLASTQFMSGIFESQVVYGNTNFQVLSSHMSEQLNLFKAKGLRIFIKRKDEDTYSLLNEPSAFVMYFNGGEWIYKLEKDFIFVSDDANSNCPQLTLRFKSLKNLDYDIVITNQLNKDTLGSNPIVICNGQQVKVKAERHTAMGQKNPNLNYFLTLQNTDSNSVQIKQDKKLNLIKFYLKDSSKFELTTSISSTSLVNESKINTRNSHYEFAEKLLHSINLKSKNKSKNNLVEQTNIILRWYLHDALVHLLSPHGLEQYGGAAWGTRDVSQGPTEMFLALGCYKSVREIIKKIYSHQFIENGNWAQWFMFDQYEENFANESHGDVVIWPLKVVVDYINISGDTSILDINLPYMSMNNGRKTKLEYSLTSHIQKQLDYIKANFLPDTYISSYGDGDWDDTLQPAHSEDKKSMASTWTEELTVETLRKAEKAFEISPALYSEVSSLAVNMYKDFKRYFMRDNVLPGFIKLKEGKVKYLIHPNDKYTNIQYRLLPLSQGVYSKIYNSQEARDALDLIKANLLFPDGVRLMNKPAEYNGGICKIFKRAELASNFGREIGLMYSHAHIRYADALATNGQYSEAWKMLQLVNPINIKQRIPNANLRQSNTYFSSSDGNFRDRYDAANNFEKLRSGKVEVLGGWRLYSSGPGIYIDALIANIFKMRLVETFQQDEIKKILPFDKDVIVSYKE